MNKRHFLEIHQQYLCRTAAILLGLVYGRMQGPEDQDVEKHQKKEEDPAFVPVSV